jgi:hypothetical protein
MGSRARPGETAPAIFAHDNAIVASEVAAEIVNNARGLVYERIHTLMAAGEDEEVERLKAGPAKRLFDLLESLDDRDPTHIRSTIATWGPLICDDASPRVSNCGITGLDHEESGMPGRRKPTIRQIRQMFRLGLRWPAPMRRTGSPANVNIEK